MEFAFTINQAGLVHTNSETEAAKQIRQDTDGEDSSTNTVADGDSVTISEQARELQAAQASGETGDRQEGETSTGSGAFYRTGSLTGAAATNAYSEGGMGDLSDEIEELEEQIEELEDEIAQLQAKVRTDESAQDELDAKRNELAMLESRLAMLQEQQSENASA